MESFCDAITEQVRELLAERADDMLKAWNENIEEAHANEAKFPPLKIALNATVDIEGAKIETVIGFAVRYSSKVSTPIDDPDQMKLPGMEGVTVTIGKKGGEA
jgi:hypothetical protein